MSVTRGSTAPGIPQVYINGAPPPAGENTPQGGGELLTDSTAAIKNAKVMAQRFNYKFNSTCCREVRITFDCTGLKGAHQGFPSGLLRGVCNTDITVDFNKPNLDWVSK